jgi:hypothetical protein
MSREFVVSRRQMLAGSAAVAGAGTWVSMAWANEALTAPHGRGIRVLLHDRRVAPDAALQSRLLARDARIVMLGDDPVRQWRDDSAIWLAQPDASVLGITRWPDFLVLRGLAAESRRHVRFASSVSDGVLTWLIA